ncbi:MAG TPA: prolyl oligopeptidase family serine peptidase [Aggregatilinea sp.]|uniref:alpha/beta hydrolase family protein n=1 Tax=Aggregatilinea sp. TaxID=2806333 RepID=UPI002CC84E0F|nr:prolyl oligopeptidase family serine peptidase [Aggregatilinea sp.]HML22692.1 prolyl oligopeptidase family serine peptidase [Aggregatilinea sp.]
MRQIAPQIPRRTLIALAALLALAGLAAVGLRPALPANASPLTTPIPSPTPNARPDGTLESTRLLLDTGTTAYYAITYWSDGLRVTGYLGRPAGSGPFPAVIYNRGGFQATGELIGAEIVPLVEAGFVAAASQYRGNAGGDGVEDFGGNDVHDVTNLLRAVQALPYVDADRIGMMGGSRGGMMTYLALKQDTLDGTHAIKAAVTVGGLADLFAWARQQGYVVGQVYVPLVGVSPYTDPAPFEARSAVYWPELIDAPLLLLHGEADTTISVQQSRTLAEALTEVGKTVEMVTFPGGDHPLTRFHSGYPEALDWFAQYLGTPGVDYSFAAHEQAIANIATWFVVRAQG